MAAFWLFSKFKLSLDDTRFEDTDKVLQNCWQISLLQVLTTQPTDKVTQAENDESIKIDESTTNSFYFNVDDRPHDPVEVNKEHFGKSLRAPNPTNDENTNADESYPFKALLRLLKVKGGITDGLEGASKIFGGVQDVGGELFGMLKDGALNVGTYLPFK